ncbi:MAG: Zn-ribbon domain-containing OB-fold protein [Candidatus Helarchaeota archaeon]
MTEIITRKKCRICGKIQHPSHVRCINCKNFALRPIESKGDATLLTYTILKAVPAEFQEQKSYALGIFEFENGIRALGQLTIKENLKTGMKFRPIKSILTKNLDGKEVSGFKFEPI